MGYHFYMKTLKYYLQNNVSVGVGVATHVSEEKQNERSCLEQAACHRNARRNKMTRECVASPEVVIGRYVKRKLQNLRYYVFVSS